MINQDVIQSFTLGAASTIPIIVAVVQCFKLTGWVKDKYAPFVSLIVGIVVTMLLSHDFMNDLSHVILLGILFGLASSGLYSGIKVTAQAIKIQEQEQQAKKMKHQQTQQAKQQDQQKKEENKDYPKC